LLAAVIYKQDAARRGAARGWGGEGEEEGNEGGQTKEKNWYVVQICNDATNRRGGSLLSEGRISRLPETGRTRGVQLRARMTSDRGLLFVKEKTRLAGAGATRPRGYGYGQSYDPRPLCETMTRFSRWPKPSERSKGKPVSELRIAVQSDGAIP